MPVAFAGYFGDTVALDPAKFRGKIAVYTGGPRVPDAERTPPKLPRCDALPDRFGADAAQQLEIDSLISDASLVVP